MKPVHLERVNGSMEAEHPYETECGLMIEKKPKQQNGAYSSAAVAGFVLALLLGAVEFLAGFGTKVGFWDYRWGISLLRWAAYGGIAVGLISLAGCYATRPGTGYKGLVLAVGGFLIALTVSGIPWSMQHLARQVPAIHDITTDPDDPPRFVALLSLRKATVNGAEYGGPDIASKQKAAYPDIGPLELSLSPVMSFRAALSAARGLGWKVIFADERVGRLEATATTFWFGFQDDVVVRVIPAARGSRIDVRSVSRVGKSDLGTNARRIREFLKSIQDSG
jgi:uncharacterized protein (DUF1499 family)